jgi:hypothetical protein
MSKLLNIGTPLPDAHNRFTQVSLVAPVREVVVEPEVLFREDASDPVSLADLAPPAFSLPRKRQRSSMNVRYTKRSRSSNAWAMA